MSTTVNGLTSPSSVEDDSEFFDASEQASKENGIPSGKSPPFLLPQLAPSNPKAYRKQLSNPRPRSTFGLWSILKNWIGRDLSRITMPVTFNEPLSFTQRLVEDIEYTELLHKAAESSDISETLSYLAAFSASQYVTTLSRHSKPFNPLLGETFEYVRPDLGYYCVTEQVSHHPPVTALHCEAEKWTFWEEYKLDMKFRGQWLRVMPAGLMHFKVKGTQHHYSWNKPHTIIHNLIFGSLWADHEGEVVIRNHQTGDRASVVFSSYSKAGPKYRHIAGEVFDSSGKAKYHISGTWDEKIERTVVGETTPHLIWQANPPISNAENQYGFTFFSLTLNQPDEDTKCPTDSRLRPDQRFLEEAQVDNAAAEKYRLEEKQRAARKLRQQKKKEWTPRWFEFIEDPDTKTSYHAFTEKYWDAKLKRDYSCCPDIF
ncbi:oxysterol-binding protein 1-like [Dysidea avara]|uniref:oxysterol-binding protein 1-like n=1 Tax=Dysidea avara TaxID=196820 RepID=UPI00332C0D2C